MMYWRAKIALLEISVLLDLPARAADDAYTSFTKSGASFEDVRENLKDAILKRGFVIDYVGEFTAMLVRTAKDTGTVSPGGNASPYRHAQFLQFCPSQLTHEAVNASPLAIANCPIAFVIYELAYEPGKVQVGFRTPVLSPSKRVGEINEKIVALMREIAQEATK